MHLVQNTSPHSPYQRLILHVSVVFVKTLDSRGFTLKPVSYSLKPFSSRFSLVLPISDFFHLVFFRPSWDQFPGCCWRGWWLMMERRTITRAPLAMVLESSSFFPFVKPMVVLFRFYTWMPFLSYDLCFSLLLSQQKWSHYLANCSPPSKNHQALCPRPDIDLGTCLLYFFLFCFFVSSPLCFDIFNSTWWWCEHLLQIRSHIPCRCSLYVLYLNLFRLHCRLWWDKVLHSKVYITTAIIIIIKANLEANLEDPLLPIYNI